MTETVDDERGLNPEAVVSALGRSESSLESKLSKFAEIFPSHPSMKETNIREFIAESKIDSSKIVQNMVVVVNQQPIIFSSGMKTTFLWALGGEYFKKVSDDELGQVVDKTFMGQFEGYTKYRKLNVNGVMKRYVWLRDKTELKLGEDDMFFEMACGGEYFASAPEN
ncbi:hypothetical protein PsorP6_016277 [Peronosclerospora sorghi]|uniref:Uncharacterized protein n=1 Tax=Peronosclerospora sorghi TaxID=230839 RepID=A0ACC0VRE7_9STRA|nr:hypothetical protein PsorP6_016277 [Peronosclerospora sorghi]